MKIILPIVAAVLLFTPIMLVIGCVSKREHWTQRPTDGPDTARKVDKDGRPNFGPK
jgi:hypothetical protein